MTEVNSVLQVSDPERASDNMAIQGKMNFTRVDGYMVPTSDSSEIDQKLHCAERWRHAVRGGESAHTVTRGIVS